MTTKTVNQNVLRRYEERRRQRQRQAHREGTLARAEWLARRRQRQARLIRARRELRQELQESLRAARRALIERTRERGEALRAQRRMLHEQKRQYEESLRIARRALTERTRERDEIASDLALIRAEIENARAGNPYLANLLPPGDSTHSAVRRLLEIASQYAEMRRLRARGLRYRVYQSGRCRKFQIDLF